MGVHVFEITIIGKVTDQFGRNLLIDVTRLRMH